jgi:hypothetical protein
MYHLGRREHTHKRRKKLVWFIFLLFIFAVAAVVYYLMHLKPDTVIKNTEGVTTTVTATTKTKPFDEPNFTIELPLDWKFDQYYPAYHIYRFVSTDQKYAGRQLDVYEDATVPNIAVNRVIEVRGEAKQVVLIGEASDSCERYTRGTSSGSTVGGPAKWQNLDFTCDISNAERDVMGSISKDGINRVNIGSHGYFFTYTEDNLNVDYTIFYEALKSFRVK